jgi:hypothetical protein
MDRITDIGEEEIETSFLVNSDITEEEIKVMEEKIKQIQEEVE